METPVTYNYTQWPASSQDQIRVMRWEGKQEVVPHRHDFIEIAFFDGGTCIHRYQGADVRLIPGDLLVIIPHEDHAYEVVSESVIYNCLFYPEALGEDWDKLKSISGIYDLLIVEPFYRPESGIHDVLQLLPAEREGAISILKTMMAEQESRRDGYELMQKANLTQLLCLLGRAWGKQFQQKTDLYLGKRNLLAAAMDYIEENIRNELKVGNLASKVYLSPTYFRRLFKETTGLTPIDYINSIRIAKARNLLEEGDMPISEVGTAVGIVDQNYFSKLFKSLTGMSPSDYRRKFK